MVDELANIQPCAPIGDCDELMEVYVMDESGKVYGWLPWDVPLVKPLWLEANSGDDFLERKCHRKGLRLYI